ncbi:MAG: hypothetical protein WBL95_23320 [Microcoleus sp.]
MIFCNYFWHIVIKTLLAVSLSLLFGCQQRVVTQQSLINNSISNEVATLNQPKAKGQSRDIRIYGRKNPNPNKAILPANFKVYVKDNVVVNVSDPGFEERTLPTVNKFIGDPGCYVVAYSHRKEKSVYSVGGGIYVMGQVRVPGSYQKRICLPVGYEKADIGADPQFKLMFAEVLPKAYKEGCWAGGDTGGWFGIQ